MDISLYFSSKTIGDILEELPVDFKNKHEKICEICAEANSNYDFDYYHEYFLKMSFHTIFNHINYYYDFDKLFSTDKEGWRRKRLIVGAIRVYKVIFKCLIDWMKPSFSPARFGLSIMNEKSMLHLAYTEGVQKFSNEIIDAFISLSALSESIYHKQVVEPRFIKISQSERATKAVSARHKKNAENDRQKKESTIQLWEKGNPKTKAGWPSMSDAAAHICIEIDKPYRTVYGWISQYEKQKRKH